MIPGFVHPHVPRGICGRCPGRYGACLQQQLALLIIIILVLEQSPGPLWGRRARGRGGVRAHIQALLPLLTFACCLQLPFSDKNQLITFLKLAMK